LVDRELRAAGLVTPVNNTWQRHAKLGHGIGIVKMVANGAAVALEKGTSRVPEASSRPEEAVTMFAVFDGCKFVNVHTYEPAALGSAMAGVLNVAAAARRGSPCHETPAMKTTTMTDERVERRMVLPDLP